ncbi:MAG: hypothetical protein RLZZ09_659 [Pseudomonadota bacterium]
MKAVRLHTFRVAEVATTMYEGPRKSRRSFGLDPVLQPGTNCFERAARLINQ